MKQLVNDNYHKETISNHTDLALLLRLMITKYVNLIFLKNRHNRFRLCLSCYTIVFANCLSNSFVAGFERSLVICAIGSSSCFDSTGSFP